MMSEKNYSKFKDYDKINNIAVLTSGGDAPGMNAAIRAIVRSSIYYGKRVFGVYHGYKGLIEGDMREFKSNDVSNIINRGGTILKTSRCPRFKDFDGRKKAYENLKNNNIDALVVIGGDGSFKGAREFSQEFDIRVVGIPGTIDNDLYGTDYTIGYDTALNVVIDAIDKIRDTAESHDRLFFVEVMGRDAGFIALRSGIASGAEAILIPEVPTNLKKFNKYLSEEYQVKKSSSIVLVAEGDDSGGAVAVSNYVKKQFPEFNVRITILGHIQRGGAPTAYDRVTASQMGIAAVEGLLAGKNGVMVGIRNRRMVYVPFVKTVKHHKSVKRELLRIVNILNV
jgi:6-phosphofructokinase 1